MKNTTVWDKTNIGENYPGTTLPLTYSFIQEAYSKVYPSFLRILGYNQKVLDDNTHLFDTMLGYINGEVYYNIDSWYEFINILPGYKYNKGFFENMLKPVKNKAGDSRGGRNYGLFSDLFNLINLLENIIFISKHYKAFNKKYDLFYSRFEKQCLKELDNKNLTQSLRYLERNFFELWGHTIVNDFRVMIFFGIYTKLLNKILNNNTQLISTHLRGVTRKPESVHILQELVNIAQAVKTSGIKLSTYSNLRKENPEIFKTVSAYLSKYGERSFNELKLEQTNFIDHPDQLLKLISYYTELSDETLINYKHLESPPPEKLPDKGYVIYLLYKVLRNISVASIHKREEFRIKRAKVFRIAHEFFKEMGTRMQREGLIERTEGIYYLYKQEIVDTLNNHRLKENLTIIVNQRKEVLNKYGQGILPRRIVTKNIYDIEQSERKDENTNPGRKIQGTMTSPGNIADGRIVAMANLNFDLDVNGKVLVTHATDPGWTILFPMLKGLVIETGGLLSHASIVAREMGIPCVVIPNALNIFKNGDIINLDSSTSQIEIKNHENTV